MIYIQITNLREIFKLLLFYQISEDIHDPDDPEKDIIGKKVLNPKYIGFQWIDGHYKLQLTYDEGYVNDHMIFWTYSLNRLFVQSVMTKIEKSMEIFNAF